MEYLEKIYPNDKKPVQVSKDKTKFPGYDIKHERKTGIEYIEVKATRWSGPALIHPTYNELKTAIEEKKNYSLYIVYFENDKPKTLYRINDPIEKLFDKVELEFLMYKLYIPNSVKMRAQQYNLFLETDFLTQFFEYEWLD